MLRIISAVIGVLVLFATQRAFPELNERFKSFSSIWYLLLAGAFAVSTFNGILFYAEPGFKYHVRTITGQEKIGIGYRVQHLSVWARECMEKRHARSGHSRG